MDPFSLAGTTVGITSLGLQVCQALVHYYGKFRSYHDEIDSVVRRTENLMKSLQALESLKFRNGDGEVFASLQKAMDTVRLALKTLDEYAKRCGEVKMPDSARDRAKLVTKRLLWPFRQDTLSFLQDTLDRTQADLALALQILGVAVAHSHADALDLVENTLKSHTAIIEIERDNRSAKVDLIYDHSTEMSSQLSSIERKLDLLVLPRINVADHGGATLPSSHDIDGRDTLEPSTSYNSRKLSRFTPGYEKGKSMRRLKCNCSYYMRKLAQINSGVSRWFGLYARTIETSDHFPGCAYFATAYHGSITEAEFRLRFTETWNYRVKAGWVFTRDSSWSTISPILSFRRVVSDSSPGFLPFKNLYKITGEYEKNTKRHRQEYKSLVSQALDAVRIAFKERKASPLDIDQWGFSIPRRVFDATVPFHFHGLLDIDEILSLFNELETLGFGWTKWDWSGELLYPDDKLCDTMIPTRYDLAIISSYFIRKVGSWSLPNICGLPNRFQTLFDTIYELLSLEEYRLDFEEDCPLVSAIVFRSEPELLRILQSEPPSSIYTSDEFERALIVALPWTRGLSLLLSCLHRDLSVLDEKAILRQAILCGNGESIRILMQTNIAVTPESWRRACLYQENFEEEILKEIFTYMATYLANTGNEVSLYCTYRLSKMAAQCLWDAGFPLIDDTSHSPLRYELQGSHYMLWRQWESSEQLVEWFCSKGCRLDLVHPPILTTAAHASARSFARAWIHASFQLKERPPRCSDFMMTILLREDRDLCKCYCSEGGCLAIGAVMQRKLNEYDKSPAHEMLVGEREELLLHLISPLVDSHDWMAPAIIRTLTFDELNLTHTCCNMRTGHYRHLLDINESEETHFVEMHDIQLLEDQVKKLEAERTSYSGRFLQFYNDVWKPMMVKLRGEASCVDGSQIQRIRELGVELVEEESLSIG